MADRSDQGTGGESPGRPLESAEIQWLLTVLEMDISELESSADARGLARERLGLVRRGTGDEIAARRTELEAVADDQSGREQEDTRLFMELERLRQAHDAQLAEYVRLANEEDEAYATIDGQERVSDGLMDRLSEQRDALARHEDELAGLYDSIDGRWTAVDAVLAGQGIALGDVGTTRDLEGLAALIAGHRDTLRRTLADLDRQAREARTTEQAVKERQERASAERHALQQRIATLAASSPNPQDQEQAAVPAEDLRALEAERSELDAGMADRGAELERIAAGLRALETQRSEGTGRFDVLDDFLDGENSTVSKLQSIEDEYTSKLQKSIESNRLISEIEDNIRENNKNVLRNRENLLTLQNQIIEKQAGILSTEDNIDQEIEQRDTIKRQIDGLEQDRAGLEASIDELLAIAATLDGPALLRAIEQLPAALGDETGPADAIAPSASSAGVVSQFELGDGGEESAPAGMAGAIWNGFGPVLTRDAFVLAILASLRELAAYLIGGSSDQMKRDITSVLIALNFLPLVVKLYGLVHDTRDSRGEDRMVPTASQYASVATNAVGMTAVTIGAAYTEGGIAGQGPAAVRSLTIGLRDMVNLCLPVDDNRGGGQGLNLPAVLADSAAYSTYSQLTTVLIGLGLVHSGAGAQAAGLAGAEAVKEVGKYVLAYTAVELMETISYRAFNLFFDRIGTGLEPPMPGDPNARQGWQGIARYRAEVTYKVRHSFAEIRRQGTDAAHARQAFTYILLVFGNIVSDLTKNQTVKASVLIQAAAFFAATFIAYFPFVGLGDYAPRPG